MDFMNESNLIGQKLFSDILFDTGSDNLQGTSSVGYYNTSTSSNNSNSIPKTSKIWQTSPSTISTLNQSYNLNTPTFIQQSQNHSDNSSLTSPFTRNGSFSRKSSMNPNAPSYIPNGFMQEQYIKSENNYTYQPKQQQLQPPISLMTTSSSYEHSGDKEFERLKVKLQSLQIDLNLRNQVIENLSELITLHSNERNLTVMSSRNDGFIDIPSNYLQLFQNMNKDLKAKTLELDQTKKRLEAIITSMSMNPQKSVRIYNGEYNEEDVAHKIVKKLSILQQENDSLLEMISSGNKMSLIIELGILRDENERLKKELEIKQNK